MLLCSECGAMLREKAKFCTQCGHAQEIVQYPPPDAPSYTRPQAPWEVPNNAQQADETLLNPEMRRLLLECIRNNRFNQLDEIVKELSGDLVRYRKLSAALTHVLFDQTLKELQPPHGSFGLYDEPHKFQRAKELINSKDEVERKEGLELFKQMTSNKKLSSHPLVYKWTLFAEASVHGLIQAVAEWEKRRVAGEASSEEIWNLAVFYVGNLDFKQALDVLRSGIDKSKAPFAHLRFALYCAAQLLGQSQPTSDTWNTARDFLSKNLNKWPAPEGYLAWMVLEREKQQGQNIEIEYTKRWKTLYNLLDQPVKIPNLGNRLDKEQARIFVERLERLDLIETLILWLNNYIKRYCAQFGNRERLSSKFEEFDFEMWQKLSKAYECAQDTEQASDILFHLALEQQKIFLKQRTNSANVPGAAFQYMRERLMMLFQFYQRNNLLQDNTAFNRFEIFYKKIPELWDDKERRNKDLIQITRPLLERGYRPKQEATIPPQLAQKLPSPPRLRVENASSDLSLSRKNGETTLSISVYNPGPGKVTKISITCSKTEKPILAFKDKVCLDSLEQDETTFVAVPVTISSPTSEEQLEFRVDLTFQWEGDAEKRSISPWLAVKLAHFRHLPNPYTFDRPIGSSSQDAQLFQGREKELNLVRERFLKLQGKEAPLYFFGMSKIGKTSLLNRLALMLKDSGEFVPCVVNLKGIQQATQQSLGEVVALLTQSILRDAQQHGLNVQNISPVSPNDQNSIEKTWGVFQSLLQQNRSQPRIHLVLLLDDFDRLVLSHTKKLLDLFAGLHEHAHILFILSGQQRPESLHQNCPGTQLFPLTGHFTDLLPLPTVKQILQQPMANSSVEISEATIERVFQHTAGHPYLVALIASRAIKRLNTEQRMMLTTQDIDEIARQLDAQSANSPLLGPLLMTSQEQSAIIQFASETSEKGGMLPMNEAGQTLGETMRSLWDNYILEYIPSNNGGYLHLHSQIRMGLLNHQGKAIKKRVGLFLDFENTLPSTGKMSGQEAGAALIKYGSQFGEIVCRWASADPRNLRNGARLKVTELEQAGFRVQFPPDEPQIGKAPKNKSDFVLVELLHKEKPDIYIIVSGDGDLYPCISTLIKNSAIVRLCASRNRLAKAYLRLEEELRQYRQADGLASDFFIDDLDEVLQGKYPDTN